MGNSNSDSNSSSSIDESKKTAPDLSWMETTDKAEGFRSWAPLRSIRFAVSKENPPMKEFTKDWSLVHKFDCPLGFH